MDKVFAFSSREDRKEEMFSPRFCTCIFLKASGSKDYFCIFACMSSVIMSLKFVACREETQLNVRKVNEADMQ